MNVVLTFLKENEVWIYVVVGLAALVTLRWLLQAWAAWRTSVFGLEREIVQVKLSTRLTVLALLGLIVLAEFLIVSFVIPSYPGIESVATPTLDVLATPTEPLPTNAVSTPTPADAQPTVGAPDAEGCTAGQVEWLDPKDGDSVGQTYELKGTVNVPNLGFYKYEYNQPGSDQWITIAAGNTPLVNGTIGYWNTTQLPTGDYQLRLVVVDNENKFFPACVVKVRVSNP